MNKKPIEDEAARIQQAILEREVEEELQRERLTKMWQKYRFLIVGGIIAVILVVAGSEFYRTYHTKLRYSESDLFEQSVVLGHTGKMAESTAGFNHLAQNGKTGYRYLAQMRLAEIYLNTNKKAEGIALLSALSENSSAPDELKSVTTVAVVGHQMGIADPEKLISKLEPILKKQDSYYPAAIELKAFLLLQQGKKEAAVKAVTDAALNPKVDEESQHYLQELAGFIETRR